MQIVLPIGRSHFDFKSLSEILSNLDLKMKNHDNDLAKITSIWYKDTEENTIRNAQRIVGHFSLSFIVGTSCENLFNLAPYMTCTTSLERTQHNSVVAVCTASLNGWREIVVNCLSSTGTMNQLGQELLKELERQGYSGIFSSYKRKKEKDCLLLTYDPH